jgi:copper chaperone CopZ
MNRATLEIDGMSCGHCVASVKNALEKLSGVAVERVAVGTATVAYDPAVVSPEQIATAVTDAGYEAVAST